MELKKITEEEFKKLEDKNDITNRRQILVYDKIYKSFFVVSVYGLNINWRYTKNPNQFDLYQLW